jgi:predicted SAM-dependent methyltransferase
MFPGFVGVDKHPMPKVLRKADTEYAHLDFVYDPFLPWPDNSADIIVCFHMIEHLTPMEGQVLLSRMFNLLKPGKQLFVSCPNFKYNAMIYLGALEGDQEAIKAWNRTYKTGKPYYHGDTYADKFMYQIREETHVWQYDQQSLIQAAKKAGCKHVETMPKGHEWNKRREYTYKGEGEEIGIIVTK